MKTYLIVILILWCAVPWLFCVAKNVAICPKCEGTDCDNPPICICPQTGTQPGRMQCAMVTLVDENSEDRTTIVENCVFYGQMDTNETACSRLAQAGKKVKTCKLSNPDVRDDSQIKNCIINPDSTTSTSTSTTSTQQTTTTEITEKTTITASDTTSTSSTTSSTTSTTGSSTPTASSTRESSSSTVTTPTTRTTPTRSTKRPTRWTQLPIFGDQSTKQHYATRWPPIRDSAQPAFCPLLLIFTIISTIVIRINQLL